MDHDGNPVVIKNFKSFEAIMEWLSDTEEVKALMEEYPPEKYLHSVCLLCREPRVVIRKREVLPVTYH